MHALHRFLTRTATTTDAGLPVPEYYHDGKKYVESNLWTPVNYNQSVREMAYGEVGNTSSHESKVI